MSMSSVGLRIGIVLLAGVTESAAAFAGATQRGPERIAEAATARPVRSDAASGLEVGEYACYGSGGQVLAGLGDSPPRVPVTV